MLLGHPNKHIQYQLDKFLGIGSVKKKLKNLELDLSSANSKITTLEADVTTLQSTVTDLETRVTDLETP